MPLKSGGGTSYIKENLCNPISGTSLVQKSSYSEIDRLFKNKEWNDRKAKEKCKDAKNIIKIA